MRAIRSPRPGLRAFTAIELIVIVGIVAVLSAISIPGYVEARKSAQRASLVSELRTTTEAFQMYAADNNQLPPNSGYRAQIPDGMDLYMPKNSSWTSTTDLGSSWYWWKPDTGSIYGYAGGILLYPLVLDQADAIKLDERIDDGNTSTGNFRFILDNLALYGVN